MKTNSVTYNQDEQLTSINYNFLVINLHSTYSRVKSKPYNLLMASFNL